MATSRSPIAEQVTRRFSPTVTVLGDAWITGAGGALGSESKCDVLVSKMLCRHQ